MLMSMFSVKEYDREFFDAHLAIDDSIECKYLPVKLTESTVALAQGSQVVCCFVNDCLDDAVLTALASFGVRLVAMRCAGYNNVDLQRAQALGIKVCRVPEYSPYAVAEHATALLLDLNRNIHRAHNRVRENNYSLEGLMGFDLHGKVVGVVGYGKIGKAFVRIMNGFGCEVLVSDPALNPEDTLDSGRVCTFDHLLQNSDIISLHCPLTPQTHHLINANTIKAMKTGVMLINTSRGALIDTAAVIQGLKSQKIGYLGIDVYEEEADLFFENLSNKVIQDDIFARLQTFPNVLITGHQGFFTKEALGAIAEITVTNLREFAAGNYDKMHLVLPPS